MHVLLPYSLDRTFQSLNQSIHFLPAKKKKKEKKKDLLHLATTRIPRSLLMMRDPKYGELRFVALGGIWLDDICSPGKDTITDVPGGSVAFGKDHGSMFSNSPLCLC